MTRARLGFRIRDVANLLPNYTYFGDGQIETLEDANGNTTTWAYDGAARLQSETNELGDARSYKYDEFGRVIQVTDRNLRVTTYAYDNLRRLLAEKWYTNQSHLNSSPNSPLHVIDYVYDAASQLDTVSDAYAAYDFDYDLLGRATTISTDLSGLADDVVFTQALDAVFGLPKGVFEIGTGINIIETNEEAEMRVIRRIKTRQ